MEESHTLIPVITAPRIKGAVKALAGAISRDYAGKDPLIVCILKGSFIFCADLVREITVPVEMDFMGMRSYGMSSRTSGFVRVTKELDADAAGRNVIVVEDIVDTGGTLRHLLDLLRDRNPASIKICALVDKRKKGEKPPVDYLGFRKGKAFLVGYGLDFGERFRNLKGLYRISGVR